MLIRFPPIFVADIKVIYGYNFVVPLIALKQIFVKSKSANKYFILNILKIFDNTYTKFADNLANIPTTRL